jgi:16S rRNA (uracil1498-N3)-methyltransferase
MARFLRFYCPELPLESGAAAFLEGDEAHHAARVLRLEPGSGLEAFDGRGGAADAEVVECGKQRVELRVGRVHPAGRGLVPVTIAVAPPKRDFDETVVHLAELGVARLVPLLTRYGEVKPGGGDAQKFAARMQKLTVSACKQSGLNWLMEVVQPMALETAVRLLGDIRTTAAMVCDPSGEDFATAMAGVQSGRHVALFIGPEGGWSEEERELFAGQKWPSVRLPGGILRTGTAAVTAATLAANALDR